MNRVSCGLSLLQAKGDVSPNNVSALTTLPLKAMWAHLRLQIPKINKRCESPLLSILIIYPKNTGN